MFEESKTFDFDKFTALTYTFVLQHSENRIVKNYSGSDLLYTGCVNSSHTENIEPTIQSIGIENINVKKTYKFSVILRRIHLENMDGDIRMLFANNTFARSKM